MEKYHNVRNFTRFVLTLLLRDNEIVRMRNPPPRYLCLKCTNMKALQKSFHVWKESLDIIRIFEL